MDVQVRRHRTVQLQDQENIYASKKINLHIPSKRQGLTVRGAFGEITNVEVHREINVGKVTTASEFEKKPTSKRVVGRTYNHVQSKVDTGLAGKPIVQPSTRPPLRREESTAGLALRAVGRTRVVQFIGATKTVPQRLQVELEVQSPAAFKDSHNDLKDCMNSFLQGKKTQENQSRKGTKLPTLKENSKGTKGALKPILKDPTECLGKLKLAEETKTLKKQDVELDITSLPELPKDIEDIDAGNQDSPLLMSIYIKDIYKYLTELEEKYPIESDHLMKQTVITGKMRATLIDWLVEVQKQFSLVLETFHLTVGIIDRYLQIVPNVQRNQLQLVGVTAMFIASKYEEIYAPDVSDFVYVTDNAYSKSDVFKCEREIMSKLGFCLARPIPLSFLRRFVKAAHGTSKNHHLAKYFVDLSLIEYSMAHYRPSELAAAAICLSLYLLSTKKLKDIWTPTLSYYSGYTLEHINPIIQKIAKIVINVENSKYKATYNKYLDQTFAKVSSLPQLKGEVINELAKIPSI